MRIRVATIEDARTIAEQIAEIAPEGMLGTEPPVDVDERAARHAATLASPGAGGAWILETDDGVTVGHLFLLDHGRGVLTVGMAILAAHRGGGGGRMLMDAALAHARTSGAHKVELEVWPDNGRAIALYTRCGFEVEGLRRKHYRRRNGSLRSGLIMALLLVDG